jgi:NADH-quinone oxidoreductase subunit J
MTEAVLFYLFSLVAVLAGFSVVVSRNPISSAMSLVVAFFFLAANYVLLDAHFVAVIQLLVYAGAIMVLFIFVIMLLNLREGAPTPVLELSRRALFALAVAGLLGVGLIAGLDVVTSDMPAGLPEGFGTIADVGRALFMGKYFLPFEVVSVLLTVAVVGAVVLAKREI